MLIKSSSILTPPDGASLNNFTASEPITSSLHLNSSSTSNHQVYQVAVPPNQLSSRVTSRQHRATKWQHSRESRTTNSSRRRKSTSINNREGKSSRRSNNNNNNKNNNNQQQHNKQQQQQSSRRRAKQQRASRWKESQAARSFKEQYRVFDRGSERFKKKLQPSSEELLNYVNGQVQQAQSNPNDKLKSTAYEIAQQERRAEQAVQRDVNSFLQGNWYGRVPKEKPPHVIRWIFENFNSLCVFTHGRKINTINQLIATYQADGLAGCEIQADWRYASEDQLWKNLFGKGKEVRSQVGHNTTEKLRRDQKGGTAMSTFGRLSASVIETGCDHHNLGRWTWILVGEGSTRTRFVVAYQPCDPGKDTAGETVWDQHARYFEALGDGRSPRTIFFEQLVSQLLIWKSQKEAIVLMGDFNEHVYSGRLAKRLACTDLNMFELCRQVTGLPIPPTHERGSRPVCAVFATQGIDGVNVCALPRKGGVGDHLAFIIDISSTSVLGTSFPKVAKVAGRKLTCDSDRKIYGYNSRLKKLASNHRLYEKILELYKNCDDLSDDDFLMLMDKWDDELTEFMHSAEENCHKYKMCHIEWSPEVGIWLSRRWLLFRVHRFLDGLIKDPRNLFRDCAKAEITDPRCITRLEVDLEIHICNKKLKEYAPQAAEMRRKHLKECLQKARDSEDDDKAAAILRILHREAIRARWKRVNYSSRKPKGRAVMSVKVKQDDGETEEISTEDGIFLTVSKTMSERFRLAFSAPAYRGKLFDDIGFLGDTEAAAAILNGTYVFPPGTDPATKLLLEEAAITFGKMSSEEVATYVSVEDFQYFWKRVNERISSSYSGLHFGHYKAASFDVKLSALHAAKLSACARKGVPLTRWGKGLTVLLEKICGNNYVHKLRAICLFEADFNWWNKLVFARRMMELAGDKGLVPAETFAKKDSHCNDAVMTKILFTDDSRIMHHPAAVGCCDLGDCYDRTAHGPMSIGLQSWGIPISAVKVLLTALQTMQFCLRTGFGESSKLYGGSKDDPLAGSGQGNGAAPPCFTNLSTLIVNAYRRLGHGAVLTSSYMSRIFILAAVLYVDDTDLLHRAVSPTTTDTALIKQVQEATFDWGLLSQATGGAMKQPKCFVYFLTYQFSRGRARMKRRRQLPQPQCMVEIEEKGKKRQVPSHISIPQPDGSTAPIPTRDVTEATEMLGVFFKPLGDSLDHIKEMCAKGYEWADRLDLRPLPPRDAWLSFFLQLLPGISWGLLSVVMSPAKLERELQDLYFRILPLLGVNRHIELDWRMLGERFGGLGLPNFVVLAFACKVYFLQSNWGFENAVSSMLLHCYESFLVEIGLYGNIFSEDFSTWEMLATDGTWLKNFWEYSSLLGIEIQLHEDFHITGVRDGDRALMSVFSSAGFRGDDLVRLNIVRHFYGFIHLSCVVLCDGVTLDPSALSRARCISKKHTFPLEYPRRKDFQLWEDALLSVTTTGRRLIYSVGRFLREPHRAMPWFASEDGGLVYQEFSRSEQRYHRIYSRDDTIRFTRTGTTYRWIATGMGPAPHLLHASVQEDSEYVVKLHSTAHCYTPSSVPRGFWPTLRSFENQTLWEYFVCDGDGGWIHEGLVNGTLAIVHDGSYMSEISTEICSAAIMVYCTATGLSAKGAIVERTQDADNYRGEILGAMLLQLVLRAASQDRSAQYQPVVIHCDNKGVVNHGNSPGRALGEKQSQADVLRCLKNYVAYNPFESVYKWVPSHQDKHKQWKDCSLMEQINIIVDRLAKKALIAAFMSGKYISSAFSV